MLYEMYHVGMIQIERLLNKSDKGQMTIAPTQ